MLTPKNVAEVEKNDIILYNTCYWIVVKAERNMLGDYDVWATPLSVPRPIPDLHLVLEPNKALMLRE